MDQFLKRLLDHEDDEKGSKSEADSRCKQSVHFENGLLIWFNWKSDLTTINFVVGVLGALLRCNRRWVMWHRGWRMIGESGGRPSKTGQKCVIYIYITRMQQIYSKKLNEANKLQPNYLGTPRKYPEYDTLVQRNFKFVCLNTLISEPRVRSTNKMSIISKSFLILL